MKAIWKILLIFTQFKCSGELVGTRCAFAGTVYALQSCDYIINVHSLNQSAYTLCITVTAAGELHVLHDAVIDLKSYL